MNLTNYEKTPIFRVFETVKREAARYGVAGARKRDRRPRAVSRRSLAAAEYYLQLEGFTPIRSSRTASEARPNRAPRLVAERAIAESRASSLVGRRLGSSALRRARCRTPSSSGRGCCARRRARRPCATCCRAARPAPAGCSRARTARARRAAADDRRAGRRRRVGRPRRRRSEERRGPPAVIVSPGTMITSRSITLRSSRTLPGQG